MIDILIVEDSPTDSYVLKQILSAEGYKLGFATDGDNIIKITKKLQPKMILMDLFMPKVDGFQATRLLKKDKLLKHIPVVICSGKDEKTDQYWAKMQGATGFISKPVDAEKLKQVVKAAIAGEEDVITV